MNFNKCLQKLTEATNELGTPNCLYRGEAKIFQSTQSSHYRLFEKSNQFTDSQASAVKHRLLTIAQMLEIVGLGKHVFASKSDAKKYSIPSTPNEINEVCYCFMQHYHLATPFLDLTTDINVTAAFAALGSSTEAESTQQGEER